MSEQVSRDDLISVITDILWRYPNDIPSLADNLLTCYRIKGKILHSTTLEEVNYGQL